MLCNSLEEPSSHLERCPSDIFIYKLQRLENGFYILNVLGPRL